MAEQAEDAVSEIERIAKKHASRYFKGCSPLRDTIRAALIEYGEIVREECAKDGVRLTKPARVGATVFRVGVKESLVIDRAQWEYEYANEPPPSQESVEGIRNLIAEAARNK